LTVRIENVHARYVFDAVLDEDEVGMLWLCHLDARGRRMAFYLLTAILKIGWRIVARHLRSRCCWTHTDSQAGGFSEPPSDSRSVDPLVVLRREPEASVRVYKHAVAFDAGDEQLFVRLAEQ
jgi:hypothetical protein